MQNAGCGVIVGKDLLRLLLSTLKNLLLITQDHLRRLRRPVDALVALTALGSASGYQLQLQPSKLMLPHKVSQ